MQRLFESLVSAVTVSLLSGYGWMILLNGHVEISGDRKTGFATAHFAGPDAVQFAVCVFLVAAIFSFFAVKLMKQTVWISAMIAFGVMSQPLWFAVFS